MSHFLKPRLESHFRHATLVGLAEADDDNDLLDDYIEAQVHGPLLLAHDVEALLEWHHGFRPSVDELQKYPDYRGAQYIELGISLAQDGYLDPKMRR